VSAPTDLDDLLAFSGWVRPAWQKDAACREHPELSWFIERGEDQRQQKRICASCLVREPCAAAGDGEFGLWGGLSERERKRLRSGTRQAA
jgi:WhiB family redox-sensing transcriptional regulator